MLRRGLLLLQRGSRWADIRVLARAPDLRQSVKCRRRLCVPHKTAGAAGAEGQRGGGKVLQCCCRYAAGAARAAGAQGASLSQMCTAYLSIIPAAGLTHSQMCTACSFINPVASSASRRSSFEQRRPVLAVCISHVLWLSRCGRCCCRSSGMRPSQRRGPHAMYTARTVPSSRCRAAGESFAAQQDSQCSPAPMCKQAAVTNGGAVLRRRPSTAAVCIRMWLRPLVQSFMPADTSMCVLHRSSWTPRRPRRWQSERTTTPS